MDARTHDAEALLADTRWMRDLARGLLGDATTAEDVVQDAWRSALERRALTDRSRSTLGGLVRTFARRFRRREARVHARELRSARDGAVPSTDELVERLELQRIVAEELAALHEPLRTALLLRYHAGLDAAEIARRVGIEHAATRKRIERGLEELRGRLDARFRGGREGWCVLLLPLARGDSMLVSKGVLLSVAAFLVTVGLGVVVAWPHADRARTDAMASSMEPASAPESASAQSAAGVPAPRDEIESERPLARPPASEVRAGATSAGGGASLAATTEVAVRVVGTDALPVAGARVELFQGTRTAPPASNAPPLDTMTTDADGRGLLHATFTWRELTLEAARDGVGRSGRVGLAGSGVKDGEPVELVLYPSAQVVVLVLDPSGAPLPGERVSLRQRGVLIGGPNPRAVPDGTTDAEGRATFEVLSVRATWTASVTTRTGAEDAVEFTMPLAADAPIPLRPVAAFVIEGRVLGVGSITASDRIVCAWNPNDPQSSASARSAADGSFVLHVERTRDWLVATAASDGLVRAPELVHFEQGEARARIDLLLVQPASCSGVVRWEDGRPAIDAVVSANASNAASADPLAVMLERFGLDARVTRTDDGGRFALDGLHPDVLYVIAAGDDEREPRRFVSIADVRPGTVGLELVFSERALRKGWVRGRVVDSTTHAALSAYELELYEHTKDGAWWPLHVRPSVDPSGGFELQGLTPGREYALSACFLERVLRTQPLRFVADDAVGTELELSVPLAAELVVEVRGRAPSDPRPNLVVHATSTPVVLESVPVDARHATTRVRGLPAGRVRVELRSGTETLDSVEVDLRAGVNEGLVLSGGR